MFSVMNFDSCLHLCSHFLEIPSRPFLIDFFPILTPIEQPFSDFRSCSFASSRASYKWIIEPLPFVSGFLDSP